MEINVSQIINELTERKINKCAIEFDENPAKVYHSGQLVSVTIRLTLREKKKLRNVFAKVVGFAFVRFVQMAGRNQNAEFTGKQIFFDERIELVHENTDKIHLIPGSYTYHFQHQLRNDLPSSLEYKYGYIRYKVCVVLDDCLWSNEEFQNTFTVVGVSTLSARVLEPIVTHNSKSFCLFGNCLATGPLETVAKIPCVAYLPRQTINLHLSVNNKSSQPVTEFTVQLVQKIKYFPEANSSRNHIDKTVLKREYAEGCEAGEEREIDVNILVPTVPPNQSSLSSICKIITIQYFIQILVSVPLCHTDPELCLPITIGSTPIQDHPDHPNLPAWINPLANNFE